MPILLFDSGGYGLMLWGGTTATVFLQVVRINSIWHILAVDAGRPIRDVRWNVRRLAVRQCQFGNSRAIAVRNRPPVGSDRVVLGIRQTLMRRQAVVVVVASQDIALFVRQHLLDGIGLLDVGDVPVPDPFP